MMESPDSSKNLRDTVFNTINLINDLESGYTQPRSKPSGKEETQLSDTFVNGIKDKMIDSSRINKPKNDADSFRSEINHMKENMVSFVESNLIKFRTAIQSQASVISSLNNEISSLKQEISSLKESQKQIQDSRTNLSQDSSQNFKQESQETLFEDDLSSTPSSSSSSFSSANDGLINNASINNGTTEYSESKMIHHSNPSESIAYRPDNSMNSNLEAKPKEPERPSDRALNNNPNPRVGNYQSSDVLIEKYFYYGNKK